MRTKMAVLPATRTFLVQRPLSDHLYFLAGNINKNVLFEVMYRNGTLLQAVDDVNRGYIQAGERLYQLKALQDSTRALEYLKLARELPGYGDVVFPHCPCDSRKDGHVVVAVGTSGVKLHACREDGALESQVVELCWDSIRQWEADDEGIAFCVQYHRPDKSPRWLKIFTQYVRDFS